MLRRAGCLQRRIAVNRAVAIDAFNFDRLSHFAVEMAVSVGVLLEMAVDAMHAFVDMNR